MTLQFLLMSLVMQRVISSDSGEDADLPPGGSGRNNTRERKTPSRFTPLDSAAIRPSQNTTQVADMSVCRNDCDVNDPLNRIIEQYDADAAADWSRCTYRTKLGFKAYRPITYKTPTKLGKAALTAVKRALPKDWANGVVEIKGNQLIIKFKGYISEDRFPDADEGSDTESSDSDTQDNEPYPIPESSAGARKRQAMEQQQRTPSPETRKRPAVQDRDTESPPRMIAESSAGARERQAREQQAREQSPTQDYMRMGKAELDAKIKATERELRDMQKAYSSNYGQTVKKTTDGRNAVCQVVDCRMKNNNPGIPLNRIHTALGANPQHLPPRLDLTLLDVITALTTTMMFTHWVSVLSRHARCIMCEKNVTPIQKPHGKTMCDICLTALTTSRLVRLRGVAACKTCDEEKTNAAGHGTNSMYRALLALTHIFDYMFNTHVSVRLEGSPHNSQYAYTRGALKNDAPFSADVVITLHVNGPSKNHRYHVIIEYDGQEHNSAVAKDTLSVLYGFDNMLQQGPRGTIKVLVIRVQRMKSEGRISDAAIAYMIRMYVIDYFFRCMTEFATDGQNQIPTMFALYWRKPAPDLLTTHNLATRVDEVPDRMSPDGCVWYPHPTFQTYKNTAAFSQNEWKRRQQRPPDDDLPAPYAVQPSPFADVLPRHTPISPHELMTICNAIPGPAQTYAAIQDAWIARRPAFM